MNRFSISFVHTALKGGKQGTETNLAFYENLILAYQKTNILSSLGNGYITSGAVHFDKENSGKSQRLSNRISASSCALGSLFALAGQQFERASSNITTEFKKSVQLQLTLSQNLTRSCILVTNSTKTKLLPQLAELRPSKKTNQESFDRPPDVLLVQPSSEIKYYIKV